MRLGGGTGRGRYIQKGGTGAWKGRSASVCLFDRTVYKTVASEAAFDQMPINASVLLQLNTRSCGVLQKSPPLRKGRNAAPGPKRERAHPDAAHADPGMVLPANQVCSRALCCTAFCRKTSCPPTCVALQLGR